MGLSQYFQPGLIKIPQERSLIILSEILKITKKLKKLKKLLFYFFHRRKKTAVTKITTKITDMFLRMMRLESGSIPGQNPGTPLVVGGGGSCVIGEVSPGREVISGPGDSPRPGGSSGGGEKVSGGSCATGVGAAVFWTDPRDVEALLPPPPPLTIAEITRLMSWRMFPDFESEARPNVERPLGDSARKKSRFRSGS
jgi:hypothetical protein